MKPPLPVAVLLSFVAATGAAACTPDEIAFHVARVAEATAAGSPCPEAAGWVRAAGFTPDEARTVHRLMWAESRCEADAYNRSGASGLMQILRMWADDCGGVPADLFDPAFNLNCARHVYEVQGWQAWSTY